MGKQPLPNIDNLEITAAGAEGNSLGRWNEQVVFVRRSVPGDVVNVKVVSKKKKLLEAEILEIVKPSPERVEPFCEHFGVCGGCKWQQMDYTAQLKYKHQMVLDAFARIGKVETGEVLPIKGCEVNRFYRNRLDYAFSNKRWLQAHEMGMDLEGNMNASGFHISGRFDKVLDVNKCWLQDDLTNTIRNSVKNYALEKGYTFFDLKEQYGLMRGLIIRNSTLGEWMTIMMFHGHDKEAMEDVMGFMERSFPQITSLLYVINNKRNDTIYDQEILVWKGKDHMLETLGGLTFKIRPKSFFQTNSRQAEVLYSITKEFAGLTGNETVYDLYTGTGTIANYLAKSAKKVVGVEYIEQAIEDARENSALNNITNTVFYAGDMKDVLNDAFVATNGRPDVIITDPPRSGMHEDVVKKICEIAPEKVVYVSCNPATQARDLALMKDVYEVKKIQPVDMFPHTSHVENVALLIKK